MLSLSVWRTRAFPKKMAFPRRKKRPHMFLRIWVLHDKTLKPAAATSTTKITSNKQTNTHARTRFFSFKLQNVKASTRKREQTDDSYMRSQAGSLNPGECCSRALRSGLAESPPPQQKLCSTGALAAVWKPPLTQNKKQKTKKNKRSNLD